MLPFASFSSAEFVSAGIVQMLFTRAGAITKILAFHMRKKRTVLMVMCGVEWMLRLLAHVGGCQGWRTSQFQGAGGMPATLDK